MKTLTALTLALLLATAALASPLPPVAPAPGAPAAFINPATAALFGQYAEGNTADTAPIFIETDRYLGFVHPQFFRPFYIEATIPSSQLPFHFACCILDPRQHTGGSVRVIHVYLDPTPLGNPFRSGFIGPIESLIPEGNEVIVLTAPFQGRRARRVP